MLAHKKYRILSLFLFLGVICYGQQNKFDSLQVLLKKYNEKHSNKTLSLSDTVKVNLLNGLYFYTVNYEPDRALEYALESLEISKKIKHTNGIGLAYCNLARIYNSRANYDLALKNLKQASVIFSQLKDTLEIAHIDGEIGIIYSRKNNLVEAVSHFLKASKGYELMKSDLDLGYINVNIGISFKQRKDYQEALHYYQKALEIFKKINTLDSRFGIAGTYSNIGNIYLEQGNYQKSLEILHKTLKLSQEFENPYHLAEIYQSMGENYMKLGQYDTALTSYTKAINYYNEIKDNSGLANANINSGYCYFKKGDTPKAISKINLGMTMAKEAGILIWQKNAYKYLAEVYSNNANYKLAFDNQVLYKVINDSIFNTENEKKITQLQMQHDFDKIQDEAQQTQKEKELKLNQETEKQRLIKYIAIIAFLCMSLLAFLIFFNLKKNQKQKAIIAQQKETVEKQNIVIQESLTEKETLLREIHHRVKNNLQIISSLLNIQSQHIVDESILSSIQEGQSRVQAMSLIHQNLYQSEHLSNVDIENYLRELVSYLSEMFVVENRSIQVEVEASHIQFDIDTAIPLGLIVNELVSNAYKYAFEKRDSGKIQIKIKSINEIDYQLEVTDNGRGLPKNFEPKKSKSLGLKLVNILSRQLRGNLFLDSDKGTSFIVNFKDIKAYQSTVS